MKLTFQASCGVQEELAQVKVMISKCHKQPLPAFRAAHVKRPKEIETQVIPFRTRILNIRHIQLPQVSVNSDGETRHLEPIRLDLPLLELRSDPCRQLNHRILLDVPPLDFYVDEQGGKVRETGRLVDARLSVSCELAPLQEVSFLVQETQSDCIVDSFVQVLKEAWGLPGTDTSTEEIFRWWCCPMSVSAWSTKLELKIVRVKDF
jgi:hypothetical protein